VYCFGSVSSPRANTWQKSKKKERSYDFLDALHPPTIDSAYVNVLELIFFGMRFNKELIDVNLLPFALFL
jgi:hypothetical protein